MAVKKINTLFTLSICLITVVVHGVRGCLVGFNLTDGGCKDDDECSYEPSICGQHARCNNTIGSYYCNCHSGFSSSKVNFTAEDSRCHDINECCSYPCGPIQQCINVPGSYQCECHGGYRMSGLGGLDCIDVDECVMSPRICGANGACTNSNGSYTCTCPPGFSNHGNISSGACTDINECCLYPCGPIQQCINVPGSYQCECHGGYRMSGRGGLDCIDVDECVLTPRICGANGNCTNTPGSYNCTCPPGFGNKGNSTTGPCTDNDECASDPPICGEHARCMNTIGSYYCICHSGFSSSKDNFTAEEKCTDSNECVMNLHICGPYGGACINTLGSYTCICPPGFRNHGNISSGPCTTDVDECVDSLLVCGPNGTCTNTPGTYTCTCPPGFRNHDNNNGPCLELEKVVKKHCQVSDVDCKLNFLNSSISTTLPVKTVSSLLDDLLDSPPDSLASKGDAVLQSTEDLVSTLAKPTDTQSSRNLTTNTTVVEILSIGPSTSLTGVSLLMTSSVSVDIDLLGIARNNNGSASVVIIVYKRMHKVLNASHFKTEDSGATSDMMSNVISIILPNALKKTLPQPVNITMKHLNSVGVQDKRWCVYWEVSSWIQDGCHVSATNSSHTICSCDHLSTFALIMTVDDKLESGPAVNILNIILVLIGLLFLTLAVMTFALCRWNPRVSNVARLNLCVCLLLAHSLFLLTQSFLRRIRAHQVLCSVLAGVLHFLFLSSFVWMAIEAVMLFLSVRKLRQVKPSERVWLQWKVTVPVGYGIPLIIVAVSAGVNPEGHGSEKCWLVEGFKWSFLGPVCFLLIVSTILFVIIIITIQSTLKGVRSDVSKVKYTRVLLFKLTVQFLILGCPWLLGMGAARSRVLEVLFLFLTSQQGTAIFLIHCLLNTEVRCQYRKWWQRFGPSSKQPESGAETGTGSGSGNGTASISLTQQPSRDT